jgi:hypothetical protein
MKRGKRCALPLVDKSRREIAIGREKFVSNQDKYQTIHFAFFRK